MAQHDHHQVQNKTLSNTCCLAIKCNYFNHKANMYFQVKVHVIHYRSDFWKLHVLIWKKTVFYDSSVELPTTSISEAIVIV
jgi:hypothetical protein